MRRVLLAIALAIAAVAVGGTVLANSVATTEVRIAAQRLDTGRVEFALQERQPDGSWGERILPRARFFPADGSGRWLASSPLVLEVPAPTPEPQIEAGRFRWSYSTEFFPTLDASVAVRNNTGQTLSTWHGLLQCVDENGRVVIELNKYQLPALDHGEAALLEFTTYPDADTPQPVGCGLRFWGNLPLTLEVK